MSEHLLLNHLGKSIHWVTIQMIRPGRLRILTEDKKPGIIPEREWTWDRSINRSIPSFKENERIQAVYLPEKSRPNLLYYSLSELTDPWKNVEGLYEVGQEVTGEVVNLRNFAAFIQLRPGITGIVWAKDLPLFSNQIPSDELVLGDKLRGIISMIDTKNRKIEIDVNQYLNLWEELGTEEQGKKYNKLFKYSPEKQDIESESNAYTQEPFNNYTLLPALLALKSVLVIDDVEEHRINIKNSLEDNYDVEAKIAADEHQALEMLDEALYFDLIVIDINLGIGKGGITLANKILNRNPTQNIIFFSGNIEVDKEIQELEFNYARSFPRARKIGLETDDLIECIDDFLRGRKRNPLQKSKSASLAKGLITSQSIEQVLTEIIAPLVDQEKLSHVFVLEVNTGTRKVKALAQYPPPSAYTNLDVDALYFSPVRQVVEEGEEFHVWNVSPLMAGDDRRLKNLFSNFSYQSCMGTTIHLSGQSPKHALFVLDQNRSFLKPEIREKINSSTLNIGTALERYAVLELLLRSQESYYKGQLLAAMIHELNNKLVPMQRNFGNSLKKLQKNYSPELLSEFLKLSNDFSNLYDLFVAYSKLANQSKEVVQVNALIKKVALQQQGLARDRHVDLFLNLDETIPEIKSNTLHTEQILANVLLNAIQQADEQIKRFGKIAQEQSDKLEVDAGIVLIRSAYGNKNLCRIEIIDSGPGVPYDQRERIFEWGVSSREMGQGMGLYISRSLLESMGGQLILADTIRFVGSMFILEFSNPN